MVGGKDYRRRLQREMVVEFHVQNWKPVNTDCLVFKEFLLKLERPQNPRNFNNFSRRRSLAFKHSIGNDVVTCFVPPIQYRYVYKLEVANILTSLQVL